MGALAGPYAAAAIILGFGGVLKIRRPLHTANALRAVGLPHATGLVRAFGAAEVAIATGALTLGHPILALLVGASYLAFAGFVLLALVRGGAVATCGCFGEPDTPATPLHVGLDVAAAAVALAVAKGGGSDWLDVLRDQPLGGLPFAVLTITCAYLGYVALTVLPQLSQRAARPAET